MTLDPIFYAAFSFILGIGLAALIILGAGWLGAIGLRALDTIVERWARR